MKKLWREVKTEYYKLYEMSDVSGQQISQKKEIH